MLQIYSLHPKSNKSIDEIIALHTLHFNQEKYKNLCDLVLDNITKVFPEINAHVLSQIKDVLNEFYINGYLLYPVIHPALIDNIADSLLKWVKANNLKLIIFTYDVDIIKAFISNELIDDNDIVFSRFSKFEYNYTKEDLLPAINGDIEFR